MKTVVLDNIFSEKELFFLYNELINSNVWNVHGSALNFQHPTNKNFGSGPMLSVKYEDEPILNYPLYLYGQSLVYRIADKLSEKKIGMKTNLSRMWFNITYNGTPNHYLHQDSEESSFQSILLFLTPVWKTGWAGSFYVDGEEFKFKPGTAIVFDSKEFHTGEEPISQTYNWQRLTCNIMVK